MKKLAALLLSLLMITSAASAQISWPQEMNGGQQGLRTFVDDANTALSVLNAGQIDMAYELYPAFASLGMNGREIPDVFSGEPALPLEMYFTLTDEGLHMLQLRLSKPEQFAEIAAACLYAASPAYIGVEQALSVTQYYEDLVLKDIAAFESASTDTALRSSFEEPVETLQGVQPRAYFAYYPDQYGDGADWVQMTLIFPRPGTDGGKLVTVSVTPAPQQDDMYEGYFSKDSYTHLEIFVTPTPEPDSAAME